MYNQKLLSYFWLIFPTLSNSHKTIPCLQRHLFVWLFLPDAIFLRRCVFFAIKRLKGLFLVFKADNLKIVIIVNFWNAWILANEDQCFVLTSLISKPEIQMISILFCWQKSIEVLSIASKSRLFTIRIWYSRISDHYFRR